MLSLASHFTQNKVSTRNPRHGLSIDIKRSQSFGDLKPLYVTTTLLNLGTLLPFLQYSSSVMLRAHVSKMRGPHEPNSSPTRH